MEEVPEVLFFIHLILQMRKRVPERIAPGHRGTVQTPHRSQDVSVHFMSPYHLMSLLGYKCYIMCTHKAIQFSCSVVSDSVTPWAAAHQVSLSITNSQSLLKLMSLESVMPSSHLILCHPLLLLPPVPPSIRVFSNESSLRMRWPKYWSFSFNISPSNEHQDWSPLGWTGWISLQSKGLPRVFSNTTVQKHQLFGAQLSSQSNSHIHTWLLEKP